MSRGQEFESLVKHGHFLPAIREQIASVMRRAEGKRVRVKISEVKRTCSTPQKRYYWAVCIPAVLDMFLDAGNSMDAEECHLWLKEHVGKLVKVIIGPDGTRHKIVRSITDTETPEFSEYLERIWQWAAELGLDIPAPSEKVITRPSGMALEGQ